jgi:large subunit ribosomal protein L14
VAEWPIAAVLKTVTRCVRGFESLPALMVQRETILVCTDNSGVNYVKCVKLFGGLKKKALLGESILIVIKNYKHRKKYKHIVKKKAAHLIKKNKTLALIVGTKKRTRRRDGCIIASDRNKVLLVSKQYNILSTRIYGFVTKELTLRKCRNSYKTILDRAKFIL